jgi:hypothetical protein
LAALLLWPLGRAATALSLAKGFWGFWTVMIITATLLVILQRLSRVDMDAHFDAYIISGLAVSGVLLAGWSAFAAPLWLAAVLYFVGLLSCWVASNILAAFYVGSIYRTVNLFVAPASFALFCLWPAAGRRLYGWFFDLYGRFLDPYGWFSALS